MNCELYFGKIKKKFYVNASKMKIINTKKNRELKMGVKEVNASL